MHHDTTRTARRLVASLAAAAALTLGISACAADPEPAPTPAADQSGAPAAASSEAEQILAAQGLDGLSTREIVDTLDATPLAERPDDLIASVRPDTLILTDATGTEAAVPMPEDAFYVSLAPFIDTTHECYFHSLTTCTGELQAEEIDVLVTDAATGEVLVDEPMTTFDNGFVGLWLPRDLDVDVTIEHDGLSASTSLSTSSSEDATCITTMQLA